VLLVLPAVAGTLDELRFQPTRMRQAVSSSMMATDLADYLVARGVAFRDAHASVGRLVRLSEESSVELDALPLSAFHEANAMFGDDARDALSAERSVERREVEGGTGPAMVRTQIDLAVASLLPLPEARGNELNLRAVV